MNDAHDVLSRVTSAYANLQSYVDRGVIHIAKRNSEPPDEVHFRTWFVRPERIRLDWSDHHPYLPLRHLVTNYVVCGDGVRFWRWQDQPERFEEESEVGLAFAGAATLDVPNLLLPEAIGAFPFSMLNDLHVEMSHVGSEPTYCLIGEHPEGGEYRSWFGKADFMLRKVSYDWRTPVEENDTYPGIAETTYNVIQRDVPVDEEIFGVRKSLLAAG